MNFDNRNPKLTDEDKKLIQEFETSLESLSINFDEERYRLLEDGIKALKQELYFASFSIFWIFIEKGLRDLLIMSELKEQGITENFLEKHEEIEQGIEDGYKRDIVKKGYSFNEICDKLADKYHILEKNSSYSRKELYKQHRIPIQHGIYGRLVGGVITDQTVKKSIQRALKPKGQISNIKNRTQVLPQVMKSGSIVILKYLPEIIQLIESNS